MTKNFKLGIDIGGTFTDLVLLSEGEHKIYLGKTLTTYPDPTLGIINGIEEITQRYGRDLESIHTIVHGTTLVTNAVIERKGSKTGLLTTKNFEDVIEIGREMRYDIYDIFITMPKPLVKSDMRKGINERMAYNGEILVPIHPDEIRKKVKSLIRKGARSIAVTYLHSFVNPEHEKITGEILSREFPEVHYSLSSEVVPEIREYERTSTTVMNAYVQPITTEYLKNLKDKLKQLGFDGKVLIMDSAGRLTSLEGAAKFPIQLLESGPAGGTMAGVYYGRLIGVKNILAFDMGGTTAKASLIENLKPEITHNFEAAREKRFKRGSGLPVRIPVIDMIEIGAGGGSIAYINDLGLLAVGPESASSTPGPACYDRGGENPTVTDADLVLGYLNPNYFLGGNMTLNKRKAEQVIKNKIAEPLGISTLEAAWGIHRIVNENMANAARVHIIEKGLDPRFFTMMAFGGAGPIHAFHVAKLLQSSELIIPAGAGVLSALGFLVSPVAKEEVRSYISPLQNLNWAVVSGMVEEMKRKASEFLLMAGVEPKDFQFSISCDMRYTGQGHEINVQLRENLLCAEEIREIEHLFTEKYRNKYGRSVPNMDIETITWRVLASGPTILKQAKLSEGMQGDNFLKEYRTAYFDNNLVEVPVYSRYDMPTDVSFAGPCIIEEIESTTVVGPGSNVKKDYLGNLIVNLKYENPHN